MLSDVRCAANRCEINVPNSNYNNDAHYDANFFMHFQLHKYFKLCILCVSNSTVSKIVSQRVLCRPNENKHIYTVSGKKKAISFSTISLVFLDRFS